MYLFRNIVLQAIDLELDATPLLGNVRCKRYEITVI